MNTGTTLPVMALAWLAGILLMQALPFLPDSLWLSALPLCLLLILYSPRMRLPGVCLAGGLWSLLHAHVYFMQVLPEPLAGKDIVITGRVLDLPQVQEQSLRFDFEVAGDVLSGRRLRLSWYAADARTVDWPRAGETWQLRVRLKPPHGSANPGGFDYEKWLYQRAVHATGYVRPSSDNQHLRAAAVWSVDALRQRIVEQIAADHRPHAGLLMALAVGYSAGIDPAQWQTLLDTGTNHLMSISGLHVGMVAALVYWLALRLLPVAWLRLQAAPPLAAMLALCAATLYAALAGFAIPTRRTLIMLAVVLGAVVWRKPLLPAQALSAALLLVLLLDPLAVLSAGFWFSFLAVAAIAWGFSGRLGQGNVWWRFGHVHLLVTLALFPLGLFLFQQTSLIAPLANLFLVPWVSVVIVPLVLIAALWLMFWPWLGQCLFDLADLGLQAVWPAVSWLADLPMATWEQPAPGLMATLLALAGILLLLAPRGLPGRWLGLVLLLPALVPRAGAPPPNHFRATVLDVGQGLSVLIQTHTHTLLFDAGPRFGETSDAGERMVLPYLRHLGIAHLDLLVISNGDADHIGGAGFLLRALPITAVTGQDIDTLQHDHKSVCAAGQHWRWDGVDFLFLHPDRPEARRNNYSCVLKVDNGVESLLIAADIEAKIERRLLTTQTQHLGSDVLIVPHHGSNTSSRADFIRAVQPQWALVSAGYRNRFGHPRREVVQRYQDAGIALLNTADTGAIELLFDLQPGLKPVIFRQQQPRYWRARATH